MMGGHLYGLESNKQEASSAGNSLGVHVHAGETCADASKVMGHYFNGTKDPWTNIIYKSDGNGVAHFMFKITKEQFGKDPRSVSARAFVVHNEDGSRAACAILKLVKAVGEVKPYPGTTGPIFGAVSYTFDKEAVTVVGAVSGVEASKSVKAGVGNSMGVHIHSGFTCSNASLVGGHYFSADQVDPWSNVVYKSTSSGNGFFKVQILAADMGTTSASTAGRAFVIHNEAGGRIGCVLLGEKQTGTPGVFLRQSNTCDLLSSDRFDMLLLHEQYNTLLHYPYDQMKRTSQGIIHSAGRRVKGCVRGYVRVACVPGIATELVLHGQIRERHSDRPASATGCVS